jgi:hypothetical protein
MKGFSILLTIFLFVAAMQLANILKQAGALPADKEAAGELTASQRSSTNDLARYARYQSRRAASQLIR